MGRTTSRALAEMVRAQRTEVDETEYSYRIRQEDPDKFDQKSFRTIEITEGVEAVVGCPRGQYANGKCSVGTDIQSYILDKEKFDSEEEAQKWIRDNVDVKKEESTQANGLPHPDGDAPHEKKYEKLVKENLPAKASKKKPQFSIQAYRMPYVAQAKDPKTGIITVKAIILEEGLNSNKWRVPREEFQSISDQYKEGRQLRLDHGKDVVNVIGRSTNSTVLKGSQVEDYLGVEVPGIIDDQMYIGAEFEANPKEPQVRTNILAHYVDAGSIGLDADLFCEEDDVPATIEGDEWVKPCGHDESGFLLRNVQAAEYSYVTEPAFSHTIFSYPSFAASVSSKFKDSALIHSSQKNGHMPKGQDAEKADAKAKGQEDEMKGQDEEESQEDEKMVSMSMAEYGDLMKEKGAAEELRKQMMRAMPQMDEKKSMEHKEGQDLEEELEEKNISQDEKKARGKSKGKSMEDENAQDEDDAQDEEKKEGAKARRRATDQKSKGYIANRMPLNDKDDLMARVTRPTETALMEPWIREIFKASYESPTAPKEFKANMRQFVEAGRFN